MTLPTTDRRTFLSTAAAGAALAAGARLPRASAAEAPAASRSPNERPVFGWIGSGIRFHNLIGGTCRQGPVAAIADVDAVQRGRGVQSTRVQHRGAGYPISIYDYEDYRRVLDRADVDAVVIATPDHWHAKMAIEAMQAGKDVYCEKPMTLTIGEGRAVADAVARTGRVLQVGTMQRTQFGRTFAKAAALLREGRVGKPRRITCAVGPSPDGFPIPLADPPKHLNWDLWLGPAPSVPYRATPEIIDTVGYGSGHPASRTHHYFRWWYEYSGGKLTDWGAHHVDIAMWALGRGGPETGPYAIEPLRVHHANPMDDRGMPVHADRYNTATRFHVRVTFQDGVELDILDSAAQSLGFGNGIMFQGERGRYFVNRGKLTGKPVEDLRTDPLPDDALDRLYGRAGVSGDHVADFVDCMRTRATPASDAESHHRCLTVCHAANVAMRLGRRLVFDPASERFVGDPQADTFLDREPRKGFELPA